MSMLFGIGGFNRSNANTNTYALQNTDGTVAGMTRVSGMSQNDQNKLNKNLQKLKKLQYNFKQISSMLMRAKTSASAKQVVTKARGVTARLRRKLRTGEYDEEELESAIAHAMQMEKAARKKMKHLQEEENVNKRGGLCEAELEERNEEISPEEMEAIEDFMQMPDMDREEMMELLRDLQEALEEFENMDDMEGLGELAELVEVHQEMDPEDLELLKKKHRSDELKDIAKADMKYLKAVFQKLERERQEAAKGVTLQLSGAQNPFAGMGSYVREAPITPAAKAPVSSDAPAAPEGGGIDISL